VPRAEILFEPSSFGSTSQRDFDLTSELLSGLTLFYEKQCEKNNARAEKNNAHLVLTPLLNLKIIIR
jgi:hypothetical protein